MTGTPLASSHRIGRRSFLGLALLAVMAPKARAEGDLSAILDPSATVRTLYDAGRWCEGPVWAAGLGGLVFSDVRANRLLLLRSEGDVEVFRSPSNNANGNAIDARGRLITCEHRTSRVIRREEDGAITVLADRHERGRLNAPNDVVVARDGAIWFTDPTFGIDQPEEGIPRPSEQSGRHVFRLGPDGALTVVATSFAQPNGLAFSPDEGILYICEAGAGTDRRVPREIRAFDVSGGKLSGERVFATLLAGVPDGVKVDTEGRVYAGTHDGVRIWTPDGRLLGRIPTEGSCANVAFGGADGRRLFICAGAKLLAVDTKVQGADWRA